MYKKFIVGLLVLTLFLVISCGTQETATESKTQEEPEEEVSTGLLTSTYTAKDENSTIEIIKSNMDNTGTVEAELFIEDTEEPLYAIKEGTYKAEYFADENADVPIGATLICGMYWYVFRDSDLALKEMQEEDEESLNLTFTDEETQEDKEMGDFLIGFKATKFSMEFIDKEDKSTIIECYNVGLGENDLEYKAYDTTTPEEEKAAEEAIWGNVAEDSDTYVESETTEEERTEFASCVDLGCDNKHIAIGDKSTNEWYYCDCFGAESIVTADRTCFSSIDVAEAVGYTKAWDCE